ncbi:MAG: hypothetical protein H6572_01105 [Lewinellaceae bacterium]|nr:hypothetical protein [Lewinellaceae bacterium]
MGKIIWLILLIVNIGIAQENSSIGRAFQPLTDDEISYVYNECLDIVLNMDSLAAVDFVSLYEYAFDTSKNDIKFIVRDRNNDRLLYDHGLRAEWNDSRFILTEPVLSKTKFIQQVSVDYGGVDTITRVPDGYMGYIEFSNIMYSSGHYYLALLKVGYISCIQSPDFISGIEYLLKFEKCKSGYIILDEIKTKPMLKIQTKWQLSRMECFDEELNYKID